MACIQKIKCSNTNHYRAIIKNKDVKTITKVFKTRKLAVEFAKRIEGNRELLLAYGNSHYHKISFKELTCIHPVLPTADLTSKLRVGWGNSI